jgi:hypothetical protein
VALGWVAALLTLAGRVVALGSRALERRTGAGRALAGA